MRLHALQDSLAFPSSASSLAAVAQRPHHARVGISSGFSLHAETWTHAHDTAGLERLCRSGARGPLAEERLCRLADGRYAYRLKRPSPSGATSVVFSAGALVRRLAALLPPPRRHLIRFHGVFGPNAWLRPLVVRFGRPTAQSPRAPGPLACSSAPLPSLELPLSPSTPPPSPPRPPRLVLRRAQEGLAPPPHLRRRRPLLPLRRPAPRPRRHHLIPRRSGHPQTPRSPRAALRAPLPQARAPARSRPRRLTRSPTSPEGPRSPEHGARLPRVRDGSAFAVASRPSDARSSLRSAPAHLARRRRSSSGRRVGVPILPRRGAAADGSDAARVSRSGPSRRRA